MLSHALLLTALGSYACAESRIKLHHRVLTLDSAPASTWTERGYLASTTTNGELSFSPSLDFYKDIRSFSEVLSHSASQEYLYQVALEPPTATSSVHWDVSSVKLCHLLDMTAEHFVIHTSAAGTPYGLDFFVGPVPLNGACPTSTRTFSTFQESSLERLNRTVTTQTPNAPPTPMLRMPPPISAEGEVIAPPVEKTLFEQYWMYAVGILLLLLLATPDPDSGKTPPAK